MFIKKEKNILYTNIKTFIDNFPNLVLYEIEGKDIFELMEEKKIPELIDNFMTIIKNNLKEKDVENKNEHNFEYIYNKIYDYILEHLYDKLFPTDPTDSDIKIFQNCDKHIWIELSNLIKGNKNYNLENYLPDSINYLKQFENEKSPRKKLLYIKQLYNCIYNLGKFNGSEVEGVDDEIPLLNITLIKTKPEIIYSNCKYTELFLGNKRYQIEGSQLTKLFGICEKVKMLSYSDLYNISESDYLYNCNLAIKGESN